MTTLYHGQCYQRRITRAYDKNFKPMTFREGDLILKKILLFKEDSRGKFRPTYEGPSIVIKILPDRALHLSSIDGDSPHELVDSNSMKMSYV